jgi:hypothetical protein
MEYKLTEDAINGIKINDKIRQEELHEYCIIDTESEVENLCRYISEVKCGSNKLLMKEDLKTLINLDDEYVLSSGRTNSYLYEGSEFNEACQQILDLNLTL